MKVKFKRLHPNAILPSYAHPGEDAGLDMTATEIIHTDDYIEYKTGWAIEIPKGYFGCLRPRSSNCKMDLLLANSPGTADSGYRGEIGFRFKRIINPLDKLNDISKGIISGKAYEIGDKIGQLLILPYPNIEPIEIDELTRSERGSDGYGSSGH